MDKCLNRLKEGRSKHLTEVKTHHPAIHGAEDCYLENMKTQRGKHQEKKQHNQGMDNTLEHTNPQRINMNICYHFQKCSMSVTIRKIQIDTALRLHLIPS